ncbi:MAG: tyrosine-type recombinase/integrase [Thermodesulfovibrionales bacterium]|nr:tyrosine-type recombinase/integrase [Thermodesulfovibrionales bacterium]
MLTHLPAFERHLRVLKALSEASVSAYSAKVREFAGWLAGNALPAEPGSVARQTVEKYFEWCFYRGNSSPTRLTKLIALQSFFRYLVYAGVIERDPTADIPRPRLTRKFVQKFTREDILSMFRQCDITCEKGLRDACILVMGAMMGFRASEISSLCLNDLVDDGKNLDVLITETKHHASRTVYLWKAPARLLRQYYLVRLGHGAKGSDPFLVSYNHSRPKGNRLTHAALDGLLKGLAKKAGLRKSTIKLHMLRATHASDLRHIRGYDTPAICERMGWSSLSSAEPYFPVRERVHKQYNSLHEYWIDFIKTWNKEAENNDDDGGGGDGQTV